MRIEKTYKQWWLVDDNGNRHNVAELLISLVGKQKPEEAPVIKTKKRKVAKPNV